MTDGHRVALRDQSLRAATLVTALLAALTVATTGLTASLLGLASPTQVAVQPGVDPGPRHNPDPLLRTVRVDELTRLASGGR